MTNYKIVESNQLNADLKLIADELRIKSGQTELLTFPQSFFDAINSIKSENGTNLIPIITGTATEIKATDLANVTKIRPYACYDCLNLEKVELPDSIISIGEHAFENTKFYNMTKNWESMMLYAGNHLIKAKEYISGGCSIKDGIICIADYAFAHQRYITSIEIPSSVKYLGTSTFISCSKLKSITLPSGIKELGNNLFDGCSALLSVFISEGVTNIGDLAFASCKSLSQITLPNTITSIGMGAFMDCTSLSSLTIPTNVAKIGDNALEIGKSSATATITCLGNTPPSLDSSSSIGSYVSEIIVPTGCGQIYKTATNWSEFADIIKETIS